MTATPPANSSSATLERLALHLRLRGPLTSAELQAHFKLSQPQLSRYLKALAEQVVRVGRGRRSLYLHTREVPQAGSRIPIYKINNDGSLAQEGVLYPTAPKGFYWDCIEPTHSRLFDDLPYFLNDLRPSGFLGRLIPRTHPDWDFPEDVRLWTAEATLRYLANFGVDLIGNQLIGEMAAKKHLQASLAALPAPLPPPSRGSSATQSQIERYEKLAQEIEKQGTPGSSAGGEHPKFLTTRQDDRRPVIVKFVSHNSNQNQYGSEEVTTDHITQRRVDLLKAEHLAAEILSTMEQATPTRFIKGNTHSFLEVERFDRTETPNGPGGRRGVISLLTLDLEFTGSGKSWGYVAQRLADQGIIPTNMVEEIRFREYFGQLIGNTDMHLGNISFFFEAERIIGLAPCYDMLPMQYNPSQGRADASTITPIAPTPKGLAAWHRARIAALSYWQKARTAYELDLSPSFLEIAAKNEAILKSISGLGAPSA